MNFFLSFHQNIMDKITEKIAPDKNPAEVISLILSLNKAAIYRRMEGKVAFTFKEISDICNVLEISLDELIDNIPPRSTLLTMTNHNHLNCSEVSYKEIKTHLAVLKLLKDAPNSRVEEVTNLLPATFYTPYEYISRFLHFKWAYQYGNFTRTLPYKEIQIEDTYRKIQLEVLKEIQTVSSTSLILDPLIFYYHINDLKYFIDVNLITKEEILLIQQDLYSMLDEMEWSCYNGVFKTSGKPVSIYVAMLNFDTNYCYIDTGDNLYISLIKSFLLDNLSTTNQKTFNQIQPWIQSMKRYSTLITQSAEKQRTIYFYYQRKIVESLTNKQINIDKFLFEMDHFKT